MPVIKKPNTRKYTKPQWDEIELECLAKATGISQPRTIKQQIDLLWGTLPVKDRMDFMKNTIPKMEIMVMINELRKEVEELRAKVDDMEIRHENLKNSTNRGVDY